MAATMVCILVAMNALADEAPKVTGTFTSSGEPVEISHVYAYRNAEGFYDPADPSWTVILAAGEIEPQNLGRPYQDFPFIKLRVTKTSEFEEQPTLRVYSQDVQLPGKTSGISGGDYPEIEVQSTGPDVFSARVWLPEPFEFFTNSWQYDLSFSAPLSENPEGGQD